MNNENNPKIGKKLLKSIIWSTYIAFKFIIMMIMTFPVSLILGISAIIMNPAILAKNNYSIYKVIVENYNTIFTYGVWFSIIFAIGIMLLNPFEKLSRHIASKI